MPTPKGKKRAKVPKSALKINYEEVTIPNGKNPKKYTHIERRAEIFKLMKAASHPNDIGTLQALGDHYGKTASVIGDDKKILLKWYGDRILDNHEQKTNMRYEKIVETLMKSGDNKAIAQASRVMTDWNNFLFNIGKVDKVAEKQEIEHRGGFSQNFKIEVVEFPKKTKKGNKK